MNGAAALFRTDSLPQTLGLEVSDRWGPNTWWKMWESGPSKSNCPRGADKLPKAELRKAHRNLTHLTMGSEDCISISAASQPSQDLLERMARNYNMPGGMAPSVA